MHFSRLEQKKLSCLQHTEHPASNTRNVLCGTQGMSCFEHTECPASNTRNVLLQTQGMSCLEYKECPAWNTWNVLFETQGMSYLEMTKCPTREQGISCSGTTNSMFLLQSNDEEIQAFDF